MKIKVAELNGTRLNYFTSKAEGWRYWLEKRGDYSLCVGQHPDSREPYKTYRDKDEHESRYTELFKLSDLDVGFFGEGVPNYATNWQQCGPLIEKLLIVVNYFPEGTPLFINGWSAGITGKSISSSQPGETPLIAICRCVVSSVFGDEVDIQT